jgi:hypothetical protein
MRAGETVSSRLQMDTTEAPMQIVNNRRHIDHIPKENAMRKVLSIRQPWASMIVRGLKRFEIRSWSTQFRGQLLIHASSARPGGVFEELFDDGELAELLKQIGISSLADMQALPRSAIVGAVDLTEVLDAQTFESVSTADDASVVGAFNDDDIFFRLSNAVEITPIGGVNGRLNIWTLDVSLEAAFASALPLGTPSIFKSSVTGSLPAEWGDAEEDTEDDEVADTTLFTPSPALAAIVGAAPCTRSDVVQRVWDYIAKHDLQDKKQEKVIHADALLLPIFGKESINIFDMVTKLIKHTN